MLTLALFKANAEFWVKVFTTTGFIGAMGTNEDVIAVGNKALSAGGGFATDHADGILFVNYFSSGHEFGHGSKGATLPVGVEASDNDAFAVFGKFLYHFSNVLIEELSFVDAYDLSVAVDVLEDFVGVFDDG